MTAKSSAAGGRGLAVDRSVIDAGWQRALGPLGLIAPAFAVVFVLAAYSLIWLLELSLTDLTFGQPFDQGVPVGLANYEWLLFSPNSTFWAAARLTAIYVVGTLVPELVLGFGIALLLHRQIRLRSVYTACLIIPIVLMPAMVGMVARLYFAHDGLVNHFFDSLLGMKFNWGGRDLALTAVILVDIWEWTPFFVLILLAGLQTLPREPYEAALVDGASALQSFRHITLPLMLPLILTALVLRFMDVLRIFDVIFAMFGGGPGTATTTLPLYVYRTTLVAEDVGRGSAASVMLIIMIVASTVMLVRLRKRVSLEL